MKDLIFVKYVYLAGAEGGVRRHVTAYSHASVFTRIPHKTSEDLLL